MKCLNYLNGDYLISKPFLTNKFMEKYTYIISKLPFIFFLLKISHVLYRCLKPFLYFIKNNFSGFEIDSKKLKLYAFIPFISVLRLELSHSSQ